MTPWTRALLRNPLENPLVARQLATSLGAGKLAWIFLLVNATVIVAAAGGFGLAWDSAFYRGDAMSETGRVLHTFVVLGLLAALAILLPLRVAGHFEAARVGQTFDQLVVTGISPLRLHFANWALGLFYAFFLLVVTLPVACLCRTLGGLSLGTILASYAVLFLYANVILATTIALSILEREWLTVPLVISTFLAGGFLCLIPERDILTWFPPALAELFPTRLLLRIAEPYAALGMESEQAAGFFDGVPRLFGTDVPLNVYPYVAWSIVVLLGMAFLLLGPIFEFRPGLNTFGTISSLGTKRRRRALVRLVPWVLSRRGEVAFLYENSLRSIRNWAAPIRALVDLIVVGFLLAVIYGVGSFEILWGQAGGIVRSHELFQLVALSSVLLGLWILLRVDSRHRVALRHGFGRWRVRRDVLILAVGCTLFAGCLAADLSALRIALSALLERPDPSVDAEVVQRFTQDGQMVVGSTLIVLFNLFLVGRVLSWVSPSATMTRTLLLGLGFLFLVISPLLYEMTRRHGWPEILNVVGYLSPSVPMDARLWQVRSAPTELWHRFLLSHAFVFALCVAALVALERKERRGRGERTSRHGATAVAAALLFITALLITGFGLSADATAQAGAPARTATEAGANAPPPLPLSIVEVHRGFGGAQFSSDRDFFTVVVKNNSSEDLTGASWLMSGLARSRERPFSVGRGTTRVLRWSQLIHDYGMFPIDTPSALVFEAEDGRTASVSVAPLDFDPSASGTVVFSDDGSPPTAWQQAVTVRAGQANPRRTRLLYGKTLALPEDVSAYLGCQRVVLRSSDPDLWTLRQRQALHDYVRLGGSVVFCGPLKPEAGPPKDRAGQSRAGQAGPGQERSDPWQRLLADRATTRHVALGRELVLEEFSGGARRSLPLTTGDAPVPVFSQRRVGPGSICHSSIDLVTPRLGLEVVNSTTFWKAIDSVLPRGRFPYTVTRDPFQGGIHELTDFRSLFLLASFVVLYALGLSLVLAMLFRARRRRRWRWAATLLLALGTSASVPWFLGGVTQHPSYAALDEVDYYVSSSGDAPSQGVALISLAVVSSGRQDHAFAVEAAEVSAWKLGRAFSPFYRRPGQGDPTFLPLDATPTTAPTDRKVDADSSRPFSLRTSPWGHTRSFLVAGALPKSIGAARAVYNAPSRKLRVDLPPEFADFDPPLHGRAHVVAYNFPLPRPAGRTPPQGPTDAQVWSAEVPWPDATAADGTREIEHQFPKQNRLRQGVGRSFFWGERNRVAFAGSPGALTCAPHGTPRLVLLWSVPADGGNLRIRGKDLLFEMDVSDEYNDKRRPPKNLARQNLSERGGKLYRSFRRRALAIEIPVEIVEP